MNERPGTSWRHPYRLAGLVALYGLCAFVVYCIGVSAGWWSA